MHYSVFVAPAAQECVDLAETRDRLATGPIYLAIYCVALGARWPGSTARPATPANEASQLGGRGSAVEWRVVARDELVGEVPEALLAHRTRMFEANSDHAYCTLQCTLNFCGDGLLFDGWELCDEGKASSDFYGSTCGSTCLPACLPAARCGDHIIQADEGEECDLGPDNDGPVGDAQGIKCEGSCRSKSLRAFVTSQAFPGNLGGLFGADKKCRDAAMAAGLGEPYRFYAYLSTPDFSANDRCPGAEPLPTCSSPARKWLGAELVVAQHRRLQRSRGAARAVRQPASVRCWCPPMSPPGSHASPR